MGQTTDAAVNEAIDPVAQSRQEVIAVSEQENLATIRSIYEAFDRADIPYILGRLAAEVEWRETSTLPWAMGTQRAPVEVAEFFARISEHVAEPSFETEELLPVTNGIVVLGRFRGRGIESGIRFDAAEAHVWKLSGGSVISFRAIADSAAIAQALTPSTAAA